MTVNLCSSLSQDGSPFIFFVACCRRLVYVSSPAMGDGTARHTHVGSAARRLALARSRWTTPDQLDLNTGGSGADTHLDTHTLLTRRHRCDHSYTALRLRHPHAGTTTV